MLEDATNSPKSQPSAMRARPAAGRAFRTAAAAFAAAASDPRTAWKIVTCFIAAHVLFWAVILVVLKGAQDVHMDVAETFAWGQKFQLGYGKHPPLSGWVGGAWFSLFPTADWAAYLLAATTLGLGLFICWLIARKVVDGRRAFLVLLMLALYPIFNFKGVKYNSDLLQLVMLPLVVLAYLHMLEKRSVRSGIWLGLAGAAALMTKYWVLTMIGAIGIAALLHPDRVRLLRSPAPWVAIAVTTVAMVPHLWWLIDAHFVSLIYARDVYGSPTRALNLQLVAIYFAHNVGLLLPVVLLTGALLAWRVGWWRGPGSFAAKARAFVSVPWQRGVNPGVNLMLARDIWIIQTIVGVVPPIAAIAFLIYMKTDWGISLFFLVPLALIAIPALRVRRIVLVRMTLAWLAVTIFVLAAAPIIAANTVRTEADASNGPRSEFASRLTQAWRERFKTRWAVVAATTEIVVHMSFYSSDHPAPFTPEELWTAGLTSPSQRRSLGFIGICDMSDDRLPECERWMAANAAGAEIITMTQRRYFHGIRGGEVTWKIFIVPPAK